MSIKAETVGTVREKERELHFTNKKCSNDRLQLE